MTEAPRFRDAVHEGGHAFGYYFGGMDIDVVSIRPGAGHVGVTIPAVRDALRLSGHPLNGMDPVGRQKADRIMVAILMGAAAEDVIVQPPADGAPVQRYPLAPSPPLAPHVAARLAAAEADSAPLHDDAHALDLAIYIVGHETATLYRAWAQAEARSLARRFAPVIHSLAVTLIDEEVMGGHPAYAVFDAALESSRKEHNP